MTTALITSNSQDKQLNVTNQYLNNHNLFNLKDKSELEKDAYNQDMTRLGYTGNGSKAISFQASQEYMKWVDSLFYEIKIENGKEVVARHWKTNIEIFEKHKEFFNKLFPNTHENIKGQIDCSENLVENINITPKIHFLKNIILYIYNTKGKEIIAKYHELKQQSTEYDKNNKLPEKQQNEMSEYFNELLKNEIKAIENDNTLMKLLSTMSQNKTIGQNVTRIQHMCTGSEYTNEIINKENENNIISDLKNRQIKNDEILSIIGIETNSKIIQEKLYKLSFLCNPGHVNQQQKKQGEAQIATHINNIKINLNIEPNKNFNDQIRTAYWDQSRQKAYMNFFNPKYATIGGFSDNGFIITNGVFAKNNAIENALYLSYLYHLKKIQMFLL